MALNNLSGPLETGLSQSEGINKMGFPNSQPILEEHNALLQQLEYLRRRRGELGELARRLVTLIHPHTEEEERLVLPLLNAMRGLARGSVTRPDANEMISLGEQLKGAYERLSEEHREIVRLLDKLKTEAQKKGQSNAFKFAIDLRHHIALEDEILYPAAVLTGELLKARASPFWRKRFRPEP